MLFFKIIIPTLGKDTLNRAIRSIENQTYKDYQLIVAHDDSGHKQMTALKVNDRRIDILLPKRMYQGGARNAAMLYPGVDSMYTLFLDDDDFFVSNDILERLNKFITSHGYPDCVRLPYKKFDISTGVVVKEEMFRSIAEETDLRQRLIKSCVNPSVAPWTKCLKSKIINMCPFPEGTYCEDAVQHLKISDVIETVDVYDKIVVCWNCYPGQTTNEISSGKHESSQYRCVADFMDLQLFKNYTKIKRTKRVNQLKGILARRYIKEQKK
jgi:glycosyltransferase involved in cell wall biosynthesis